MRLTLTPDAGTTSNCVTTGPVVRPPIRLWTPNERSFSTRTSPSCESFSSMRKGSFGSGASSRSIDGNAPPAASSASCSPAASAGAGPPVPVAAGSVAGSGAASGDGSAGPLPAGSGTAAVSPSSSTTPSSTSATSSGMPRSIPRRAAFPRSSPSLRAHGRGRRANLPRRSIAPHADLSARPSQRSGFQSRVATSSPIRKPASSNVVPSQPMIELSPPARVDPSHPAPPALPSSEATQDATTARPAVRIAARTVVRVVVHAPARSPPSVSRTGSANAAAPSAPVAASRNRAPSRPIAFPEGNHASARAPRTDTGTSARSRNSARTTRDRARMSDF